MKKTACEKVELLIVLMLTAVMVGIPATHYICAVKGLYYSYIAKTVYYMAVPLAVITGTALWMQRKNIRLTPYEKLFLLLVLVLVVSWRTAVSPEKAFRGESGRNEGLLMLLCYYLLFYGARLISGEKNRRRILNIFLAIMTIHAVYGIAQLYEPELYFVHDYYHYAISGVTGNPNFMGSLMVLAAGVCMGMAIYSDKIIAGIVYVALLPLFVATLIFTRTMSAYLGLGVVIFAVFVIFVKFVARTKGKKSAVAGAVAGLFIAVAVLAGANALTGGVAFEEIMTVADQLKNKVNPENLASGRFLIWTNIFRMLPEYLFFGVGIDCLQQPYFDRYGLFKGTFLNKAHNELIHILITAGIFAFVCYIVFYLLIAGDLKERVKAGRNKAVDMALLFAFTGYMCQAMFNISVVDVAPYFWIMLGLSARPLVKNDDI